MLNLFLQPWQSVPTCWIDTETTGLKIGIDRAVQVAIVRFENGIPVNHFESLINPGITDPWEGTAIHGKKYLDVMNCPSVEEVFEMQVVQSLLKDAQPGAYNAPFDRRFIPMFDDWQWPWLDALTVVRALDKYVSGKGRHKLDISCVRHGVELGERAHNALDDATAAGKLFYKLVPELNTVFNTLGELLCWQQTQEASQWYQFNKWRANQPPINDTCAHEDK